MTTGPTIVHNLIVGLMFHTTAHLFISSLPLSRCGILGCGGGYDK